MKRYLKPCKKPTAFYGAFLLALMFSISSCVSWLAPSVKTELIKFKKGQYKLDPNHASLIFKVRHLGLSNYVGRFKKFNAELDFNPQNPLAMELRAVIDVGSIDVNNPDLEKSLKGSNWFDIKKYPQAYFLSKEVLHISENEFLIKGDLTLKGVTKEVGLKLKFYGGGNNILTGKYTLGFNVEAKINRVSFEVDQYVGLVSNEVYLEIDGEFVK